MAFVHLHIHSEYSLLESGAKIEDLVQKAKKEGFTSLALTDRSVMHGAVPFYQACIREGIKPIIGVELPFRFSEEGPAYQLLLLALSTTGYQCLLKLTTKVKTTEKKEPFMDLKDLQQTEDIIVIQPMEKGPVQTLLQEKDLFGAEEVQDLLKQAAPNDVYIEVQQHYHQEEREKLLALRNWLSDRKEKAVASNHLHAVEAEDTDIFQLLSSIRTGTPLSQFDNEEHTAHYYMKSEAEMREALRGWEGALEETNAIAERCEWELPLGQMVLPEYPDTENASLLLRKWCEKGMYNRYKTPSEESWSRLEHELSVIESMQFADYFLIVADFMNFAHREGITTGPGRGSAAGSLVAYVLKITNVDPIKYQLLFERFLNPERISMPDIDIDFADTKRDKVIHYVAEKYGKEHVAQIVTFGTFAAKAAVRDAGRSLGTDPYEVDRVAKAIPAKPNIKIADAEKRSSFIQAVSGSESAEKLVYYAKKLEGLPRHSSVHAAGIVMSRDPLTNIVPLQTGNEGMMLTQYPMGDLEKLGLLKMDFLGLRNLTLIDRIQELSGIDAEELPLDEPKVFKLLSQGDTSGIFQLESQGMQKVLKQLKPTNFEDIVAVNALYRPGPMEFISVYVARKHGQEETHYIHQDLKPILEKTHGVLIYQEQIMQIAAKMAGFKLGEADLLRRAVSKKKREELEEGRRKFVEGAAEKGYRTEEAEEVYDLIVRFADYGFNRSHAVAYSMISYQLAYLKTMAPEAFYTGLMEGAVHDQEKLAGIIHEAKLRGINILSPSVQTGDASFTLKEGSIQIGLASIKYMNYRTAEEIVRWRSAGGYEGLFELCAKLPKHLRARRMFESLILSGALDEFGENRATLLATIDSALEYAIQEDKKEELGEVLFPDEEINIFYEKMKPLKREEELKMEKEVLGFYVSGHPLEEAAELLVKYKRVPIMEALKQKDKSTVRLAGLLTDIRSIQTKKKEQMAFLHIEDESGETSVTVFPKAYKQYQLLFGKNEKVFIEGTIEEYEGERKVILNKCTTIQHLLEKEEQQQEETLYLYITVINERERLAELKNLLENTPGTVPVVLKYESSDKIVRLSEMWNVAVTEGFLNKLQAILGKNHVYLKKPRV
ncbi:DNA polymerase III subunit alpha [Alkalicoccus daliensis]|uniref:DNA polymerase III subunit alpha n=1 Tax=Alkalicoccus daliensis TaxID=745820 RepID=A0A1H0CCM1_9BACI|nr:DNA polymerase III subunit alpha [Alkalicoccus daliensis]SDN55521.1 DNA polymerase-3 subunit alpha [Alkalicoccus daliensis]